MDHEQFDKDFNDAKKFSIFVGVFFLVIVGGVAAALIYAIIKATNHYF